MKDVYVFISEKGNRYEVAFTNQEKQITTNCNVGGFIAIVENDNLNCFAEWVWSKEKGRDVYHLCGRTIDKCDFHTANSFRSLAYQILRDYIKEYDTLYYALDRCSVVDMQQMLGKGEIRRMFDVSENRYCDFLALFFNENPQKDLQFSKHGFVCYQVDKLIDVNTTKKEYVALPICSRNMMWMGFWEESGVKYRDSILSNEFAKL